VRIIFTAGEKYLLVVGPTGRCTDSSHWRNGHSNALRQ